MEDDQNGKRPKWKTKAHWQTFFLDFLIFLKAPSVSFYGSTCAMAELIAHSCLFFFFSGQSTRASNHQAFHWSIHTCLFIKHCWCVYNIFCNCKTVLWPKIPQSNQRIISSWFSWTTTEESNWVHLKTNKLMTLRGTFNGNWSRRLACAKKLPFHFYLLSSSIKYP